MTAIPHPMSSHGKRTATRGDGLGKRLWRFSTSVRLAMAVMGAIAAVTLAGTLVDQVPPAVAADRTAYAVWLEAAHGRYGVWTGTLERLELFNVFHTLYFKSLLGLLALNISLCTINRWRGVWATVFHVPARRQSMFFEHAHHRATLETVLPATVAAEHLKRTLSRARYRVTTDQDQATVALCGDKNRLSRFATFLTHLGIVMVLAGGVVGGMWGFNVARFPVSEGSTRALGLDTGISVRLDHFAADYHPDGTPSDFRSDITIFDDGKAVKTGSVRVNSPLRYNGVAFHQSFFGQSAVIRVEDASGRVIFHDGVPLSGVTGEDDRPAGRFDIPELDLAVYVAGPLPGAPDTVVPPGEMRIDVFEQGVRAAAPRNLPQGMPANLGGLTFTFERETRFAGFQVAKDPGFTIVWVAGSITLAGIVMLFWLPRRRLWVLCRERPGGGSEVMLGMPAQRDLSAGREFDRIHEKMARALQQSPRGRTTEATDDA